jgi:hypothetical protein
VAGLGRRDDQQRAGFLPGDGRPPILNRALKASRRWKRIVKMGSRTAAGAALLSLTMLIATPAFGATKVLTGAGANGRVDCAGGSIAIEGADNTYTITGACTALEIHGAGNRIDVNLAAGSTILVEGAGNTVVWTAPQTARPKISASGVDNRIYRAGTDHHH